MNQRNPKSTRSSHPAIAQVLKAPQFDKLRHADEVLSQAQSDAQALLKAAELEAETIRQQARSDAVVQRQRAHAEGAAAARQELAQQMTNERVQQAQSLSELDERIGVIVTRTLAKILSEKDTEQTFFTAVIRRVLQAAREEKFLTLRVCADQQKAAQQAIDRVLEQTQAPNFVEVVADQRLSPGSCIVESPNGVIDASLDTQLDAIRTALTRVWIHPDERRRV